jgi:hypothetical protein
MYDVIGVVFPACIYLLKAASSGFLPAPRLLEKPLVDDGKLLLYLKPKYSVLNCSHSLQAKKAKKLKDRILSERWPMLKFHI